MYSENQRIQLELLNDKILKENSKIQHNNKTHTNARKSLVDKYMKITEREFLEKRIAKMIAKDKTNITLICDDTLYLKLDRDVLVTTPLCELDSSYTETRSIIKIIRDTIPKDYRIYYHYNYADGNHGNGGMETSIENYEISIYRDSVIWDPWCNALCCWCCSFRFTEQFDREIII
jgi:hypothetical protein